MPATNTTTSKTPKQDLSPRLARVLDELESITRDMHGDEEMIDYLKENGDINGSKGV